MLQTAYGLRKACNSAGRNFVTVLQRCRARLPAKAAGQGCRARLPGKSDGQVCRACLPGTSAGHVCRVRLPGKSARQVCPASLPGKSAWQVCPASLPGKSARQVCPASLPGKSAGQVCRASLPGKSAGQHMIMPTLGETMMIEADVNLGFVLGGFDLIPIMAHPPIVISDLSLEMFLDTIIEVTLITIGTIFRDIAKPLHRQN
jgi:hypothetical protein